MKIQHALTYSDVFPEEKMPSIKDLLSDTPTRLTIEYLCYFNGVLHMNSFAPANQLKCLQELLGGQPQSFRTRILHFAAQQKQKYGLFLMFDIYTSLLVINNAIAIKNDASRTANDSTDAERESVLRAVLAANQKMNDDSMVDVSKIDNKLDKFCNLIWPNIVQSSDHRVRNDFIIYGYKSYTFLEYVKTKPEIAKHLLKYLGLANEEELYKYILAILHFYVNVGLDRKNNRLFHAFDFDIETEHPIIKNFIIDLSGNTKDFIEKDFKSLRQKPIIKIRDKRYNMTNWNFLLEKLGNGLIFDLFYNTDLKNSYLNKNGVPQFDGFKGTIGDYYSEKLFQKIFNEAVLKTGDIYKQGDPTREDNSDFYLRRRNKIVVIEFKDALMVKHRSYEQIKGEVDRKLNTKNKGTGQLKKLIEKLKTNVNVFEDDLRTKTNTKKLVVYPVIIVTEALFSSPGFTQYLNKEFKKLLEDTDLPFYVKPLTVIDFDFFLENYDSFRTGKMDFFKCLDYFIDTNTRLRLKARRSNNVNTVIASFNGFREIVWRLVPKNSIGHFGTLGNYVINTMKLEKS